MQIILKKQAVELGLKKYFTGKPCKQGHISERYVAKSTCCECLRISALSRIEARNEYNRKRYHNQTHEERQAERKRLREYNAKQYWIDPEKYRERSRRYRIDNLEKVTEKHKIWKDENRVELLARRREQYSQNVEKYRRIRNDYYARNAELEKSRQYVARSKNMTYYNKINKERLKAIKQATPKWADQSKIDEIYFNRKKGFHVDHIVPLNSKFVCGLHCEANLQYLTVAENIRKRNKWWPDMWE